MLGLSRSPVIVVTAHAAVSVYRDVTDMHNSMSFEQWSKADTYVLSDFVEIERIVEIIILMVCTDVCN
jgi:hypothetical protein